MTVCILLTCKYKTRSRNDVPIFILVRRFYIRFWRYINATSPYTDEFLESPYLSARQCIDIVRRINLDNDTVLPALF